MRSFLLGLLGALSVASAALLGAGCTDLGVGRKCLSSGDVKGTQLSSPALECLSKLCYLHGDENAVLLRAICTAHCATNDDCKNAELGDAPQCNTGFVCGIATDVDASPTEHIACQTVCLCKDDLSKLFATSSDPTKPCCPQSCDSKMLCPAGLPKCQGS